MEKLCKELEEMKFSVESLTEECRAKATLSDNLKRVNNEQLSKLQEARAKIEKQAKEIDEKDEEILVSKHMCEDLKSKLSEKASALKHLSLANENFRANIAEKVKEMGEEKKQLLLALEESNSRGEEQDNVISSCRQEIERLRGLLSVTQKKCVDAEESAKAPREVRRRDEMIAKLEHDKGDVEEQLKWRSEQFRHLEEAHDKIQTKFRACKKEWDMEKSNLVDEVYSLQTNLDSKTRMAEDLRSKLHMCNQALAREESRRNLLEIQMSESKALYENVMSEYEETRMNIKSMTTRRDEEIAELRNSLATKATLAKELDFRTTHLEQENEQLRAVLKELREDQIDGAGAVASFKSLQHKFRALEQAHRGCSEKLKARDEEWSTETEKLSSELEDCLLKLNKKDKQLQCLQTELTVSNSSLVQQKLECEEISVVLLLLKSKFLESCLVLEDLKHDSELHSKKMEEKTCLLMEQLDKKNSDLVQAQAEIKREHESVASLLSKVEYLESVEQEYPRLQKEINSYKVMLEVSSKNIEQLKEDAARKETNLLEDTKKALEQLMDLKHDSELHSKKMEEKTCLLMEQLDRKSSDLVQAEAEIKREHERVTSLLSKVEYLESVEQVYLRLQKEINSYKLMLEESSKSIEQLKEEAARKEINLSEDIKKALTALDEANSALAEKCNQLSEVEFRLEQSILVVDRMENMRCDLETELKKCRDENISIRNDMEDSSLARLEAEKDLEEREESFLQTLREKEKKIEDLQQQLAVLEEHMHVLKSSVMAKVESEKSRKKENEKFLQFVEDTDRMLRFTQKEVDSLEQNYVLREIGCLTKLEVEKIRFQEVMVEKEKAIADLQHKFLLYEQDFSRSVEIAASIKQRDAEMELCSLSEALERALSADILDKQEIYYKNGLVAGLEEEILSLHQKAEEERMSSAGILMQLEEEITRLLQVMQEKERVIADMHKKVLLYEQEFPRSVEITASIKQRDAQMEPSSLNEALEKTISVHILDKQEIYYQSYLVAELEEEILSVQLKAEEEKMESVEILMILEEEKNWFQQVMEERGKVIADMQQKILSHEQDYSRCVEIAGSIRDAQMEISTLNKALENILAACIIDKQEIYYRNNLVAQLEEEIHFLQQKVEFEGKLSLGLKNHADDLEVKLATVLLEREKEKVQFDIELKNLLHTKATLETLAASEKKAMYGSMVQLSSDREDLIKQMMGLGEVIGNISDEGEEFKRKWDRVMQMATDENAISRDVEVEDQTSSRKVHGKNVDSPSRSKAGQFLCRRLPLKEQNC